MKNRHNERPDHNCRNSSAAQQPHTVQTRPADENRLILSEYAAAKLAAFAKAAGTQEFMILLLGRREQTNVVLDVYLLKDQRISVASVQVSGHAINQSMWDLEDRYGEDVAILGWGHGHGSSAVFHSSIDDANSESVFLDELAPLRIVENEAVTRLEADPAHPHRFILGPNGAIKITGEGFADELLHKLVVEKVHPVYQGSVYSLVTNADNEYYAERFTKTFCHHCDHIAVEHQQIPIVIAKCKKRFRIDEEALRAEFREKTGPRWCSSFSWRDEDRHSDYSDYNNNLRRHYDEAEEHGIIIHHNLLQDNSKDQQAPISGS